MEPPVTAPRSRYRIDSAGPADEAALNALGRRIEMPGIIRLGFEREPGYFDALRVEGRWSEVHVCRETASGRIVGCGHRSGKPLWVDGKPAAAGYLSGLRLEPAARGGRLLAQGFAYLRRCHGDGRTPFYLTTVMEDNQGAAALLAAGRAGLPRYLDRGRFAAMAIGLDLWRKEPAESVCEVRPAVAADAPGVLKFLAREGRRRQFFPIYQADDFGPAGNLLYGLAWEDVMLAFRNGRLIGVAAAWDQRAYRRWRVTGYSALLRVLRRPLNFWARFNGMPRLPKPGAAPRYFNLALTCVAGDDLAVFGELLWEIIRSRQASYDFFLAGMHEADPLLPRLRSLPHMPLPSRLYLVAWPDGDDALARLDPARVPYLELGSL